MNNIWSKTQPKNDGIYMFKYTVNEYMFYNIIEITNNKYYTKMVMDERFNIIEDDICELSPNGFHPNGEWSDKLN